MVGFDRLRSVARIVLVAAVLAAGLAAQAPSPDTSAASLPRWTGGIDLYRTGVFTTQQTWLWCTAADVQIIRNIADHQRDHSRSAQQRYFDYMRAHNRYDIPVRDGVDPAGWAAGLRHFVDSRYRLVASGSFASALRSAVTSLRKTNLPVGITVSHGNHAWVLTGFTATADPATTTRFTVTSVRVVGPLWGLQSRSWGYDMRPDTKLTPSQLRGFFTPWHYAGVRMAWEGDWVSIQPIPAAATPKAPTTKAASPTPASPSPSVAAPTLRPSNAPSLAPSASATASPDASPLTAVADGRLSPAPSGPAADPSTIAHAGGTPWDATLAIGGALIVLAALAVGLLVRGARRRPGG